MTAEQNTGNDLLYVFPSLCYVQDVLARQKRLDRSPPYCLAKRVRNQVYYETSKDLGCTGAGNQVPAAPCMNAALQVFAGEGKDGLPPDLVKALCMY